MPYNPGVQDISGQLLSRGMEQAALMRSQAMGNIGTGIANAINVFQKRKEEEQDFMAKAKSMESFIKSHADDFAPVDPQTGQKNQDAVLQFLQKNPDESTRQYYMKLGTFLDTAITGTKMQKEVAATRLEKARADTAEAELKDIKDAAKWNQTYGNVDVLGNLMGGGKPGFLLLARECQTPPLVSLPSMLPLRLLRPMNCPRSRSMVLDQLPKEH